MRRGQLQAVVSGGGHRAWCRKWPRVHHRALASEAMVPLSLAMKEQMSSRSASASTNAVSRSTAGDRSAAMLTSFAVAADINNAVVANTNHASYLGETRLAIALRVFRKAF